jgi:glycosyltransferase involved in cell wall biosynthesis
MAQPETTEPAHTPRRVLFVNHVSALGGAEKSLLRLLESLDRRRVSPLVALPGEGALAEAVRALGIPVHELSLQRMQRPRGLVMMVRQARMLGRGGAALRRLVQRESVELVHANSLVAALAAWRAKVTVPLVWQARDLRAPGLAVRAAAGASDLTVAISRAVADWVAELAPQSWSKLAVVYNGIGRGDVEASRDRFAVRQELGVTPGVPLIGCIGQTAPWKQQELFLRAGAILIGRLPDARLVMVGGQPFEPESDETRGSLQALAVRLGVSDRLIWTGLRDDIPDLMGALDVLIHPASREPLGRVVLEALACGLPCVAVDDAGPAEIIEHGVSGLLVPPEDPRALAAATERILRDPQLADRLREGGLSRVRSFLARDKAAQMVELYEQIWRERATSDWRAGR